MTRLVAVVGLLVSAALVVAAPARPLYEPSEAPKPPVPFALAGTTWVGKLYSDGERVTFHADGTLTYGYAGSGSPGSWKMMPDHLYFEINKWSEYKVTVNGDVIQGIGWNKSGQKTQPFLRRSLTEPSQPLPKRFLQK